MLEGDAQMFLYLDGYGYKVSKSGDLLVVEYSDGTKEEHRFEDLDAVYLSGEGRVSKAAFLELVSRNTNTILLSEKGKPMAHIFPADAKPKVWDLWKRQILLDPRRKAMLAKRFVLRSIRGKIWLLTELARNRKRNNGGVAGELIRYRNRIKGVESKVKNIEVRNFRETRKSLMGWEGFSARLYFEALANIVPESFGYTGLRTTRPPRDLFNACISFGYGYLRYLVERSLILAGLNPYYGILHEEKDKVYSFLTFDVMEGLRHSFVDREVISMISKRRISPAKHSKKIPGGVLLNKWGRDSLYRALQASGQKRFYRLISEEVKRLTKFVAS